MDYVTVLHTRSRHWRSRPPGHSYFQLASRALLGLSAATRLWRSRHYCHHTPWALSRLLRVAYFHTLTRAFSPRHERSPHVFLRLPLMLCVPFLVNTTRPRARCEHSSHSRLPCEHISLSLNTLSRSTPHRFSRGVCTLHSAGPFWADTNPTCDSACATCTSSIITVLVRRVTFCK